MRKRYIIAALMTILLSFSSCVIREEMDVESTPIINYTITVSPVVTLSPAPTVVPSATERPTLSPTPAFITREGIDYVYEVLESYYKDMDNWDGSEFYGADRALWFMNYDPANTIVMTGEDIISASPSDSDHIYYYEDTTGKMKVEDVAKELVKLMLEDMSSENSNCTFQVTDYIVNSQVLYNKENLIENMKKKAAIMTLEDVVFETQEELDYLQQNMRMLISMYPALQEDMWLLTPSYQYRYEGNVSPLGPYPKDAGEYIWGGSDGSEELYYFVIMKYGNVYRMQNHYSFCSYARGILK